MSDLSTLVASAVADAGGITADGGVLAQALGAVLLDAQDIGLFLGDVLETAAEVAVGQRPVSDLMPCITAEMSVLVPALDGPMSALIPFMEINGQTITWAQARVRPDGVAIYLVAIVENWPESIPEIVSSLLSDAFGMDAHPVDRGPKYGQDPVTATTVTAVVTGLAVALGKWLTSGNPSPLSQFISSIDPPTPAPAPKPATVVGGVAVSNTSGPLVVVGVGLLAYYMGWL